jgi:Xaa-Pro dipeptidase
MLPFEERDRRWKNVRDAMEKRGLSCLLVWGCFGRYRHYSANLIYLCGMLTEGFLLFPLEGDPTLFGFAGGRHKDESSWVADTRGGHPRYSKTIAVRIREVRAETARIGIPGLSGFDGEVGFPHVPYAALSDSFPGIIFEDATDILENARMIKGPAEIRCLEQGCEAGEKAIQAVIDTARPGVMDYEVTARMMDTLFREGCEPGGMLLYNSGQEGIHGGTGGVLPAPKTRSSRRLGKGDIINTEFDACYMGYLAQFNQPFSLGKPDGEWERIFGAAEEAFNKGLSVLKPGITAGELGQAILSTVFDAGFVSGAPPFHGLGVAIEEPFGRMFMQPDFEPNTARIIAPGMVLELEPHVVTKDFRSGTTIGSPVLITDTGYRLLSRTWKPGVRVI